MRISTVFLTVLTLPTLMFSRSIYDTYSEDPAQHRVTCSDILKKTKRFHVLFPLDRVLLTASCGDCDYIPKIKNAGKIFYENGISYQLMHNGIKIVKDSYVGNWMTDLIYTLQGHHEPQEEKVFYEVVKHLPEIATMVELGSNWGYYSLWFASVVAHPRNYLIEPVQEWLRLGEANFHLNSRVGTFIHGHAGASVDNPELDYGTFIHLDRFAEAEKLDHIHILHSDIQGAEYEMLKTCQKLSQSRKVDYFFISTHSEELHVNCIRFFIANSYSIIAEHSPAQSVSVDGLIVAKRAEILEPKEIHISKNSQEGTSQ